MSTFRVGIVCDESAPQRELAAQLAILGEQVVPAERADGLFCVGNAADYQGVLKQRPFVQCHLQQATEQTAVNAIATNAVAAPIALPASRPALEGAIVALHKVWLARNGAAVDPLPEIIGSSDVTTALKRQLAQVAEGDSTVLLTGPSGTGKSFLAETMHRHSPRRAAPFVPVNCGAIPTELIESELFGHEKGAFTGALDRRLGRFDLANGGTLFLDEIGDMPYGMQVKLLRAIQERVFERVGGVETHAVDVRIVAATNVDLEARIRDGAFREDLFYRLNVFPIPVPALHERSNDIPELVEHFRHLLDVQYGHSVRFSTEALQRLQAYQWPGNLRELANLIERLTVEFGDTMLGVDSLPAKYQRSAATPTPAAQAPTDANAGLLPINGIDLKAYLAELEQALIEQALRDTDAVVARAADRLHIRRTTLVEKMRKYGIDRSAH